MKMEKVPWDVVVVGWLVLLVRRLHIYRTSLLLAVVVADYCYYYDDDDYMYFRLASGAVATFLLNAHCGH